MRLLYDDEYLYEHAQAAGTNIHAFRQAFLATVADAGFRGSRTLANENVQNALELLEQAEEELGLAAQHAHRFGDEELAILLYRLHLQLPYDEVKSAAKHFR